MSDVYQEEELETRLKKYPEWEICEGKIVRVVEFESYMEGIDFVNTVAELAEEANHHPDLQVGYGQVKVSLISHDSKGVTNRDLELAREIDNVLD